MNFPMEFVVIYHHETAWSYYKNFWNVNMYNYKQTFCEKELNILYDIRIYWCQRLFHLKIGKHNYNVYDINLN